MDECALRTHDCSSNARCINTDGSYACSCNPGYTGDGRSCQQGSVSFVDFLKVEQSRLNIVKCKSELLVFLTAGLQKPQLAFKNQFELHKQNAYRIGAFRI